MRCGEIEGLDFGETGSVLGGLRNTVDNMLTGVMALVTEPDRTLMKWQLELLLFKPDLLS